MYARGMTTRDFQGHLEEIYGIEVSPTLIFQVTDAVTDEVKLWQNRPLDEIYPIVYLDAVRIKVSHNNQIINKAVYMAIGVNMDGIKEALGMWAAENEGAKFWLQVVTELKNRGVNDIFIACVDGLKGFPEAIEAVFPNTEVQLCIVRMMRHSLNSVSWKQCKEVAEDLRAIYQAPTIEMADKNLDAFAAKWDATHPTISRSWRNNWERIITPLNHSTCHCVKEPRTEAVPQRRSDVQTALSGSQKHSHEMDDTDQGLEVSFEPVHYRF